MVVERKDAEAIDQDFSFKIVGRFSLEDIKIGNKTIVKKGEIIGLRQAKAISNSDIEAVRVRSVLTCNTVGGVCAKCYGWDMGHNEPVKLGEAVGMVAAQAYWRARNTVNHENLPYWRSCWWC